MGIISSNKSINTAVIECAGSLQVELALTSAPDIQANPTDIALVLDRSGSMEGTALESLKVAVKQFIHIIADATGGDPDEIGSGSRIGIVSFSDTATDDTGLITSVVDLEAAVDALVADGRTNHSDAFTVATVLLAAPPANKKVIIMFTDGVTTEGPDPNTAATAAKDAGITVYTIGLNGTGGVDEDALENWASLPTATHVAIAPTPAELEQLFADLAANITKPGAINIKINDFINPDFVVTSVGLPSVGTAIKISDTQVEWTIGQLGVTQTESAVLQFTIEHIAATSGDKEVNTSITYVDDEGNSAFNEPSPVVSVACAEIINAEVCPAPIAIPVNGCEDLIEFNLGDLQLDGLGRIVELDVNLLNICPNRRVAMAVVLTELDIEDNEYPRGMKTFTLPAHTQDACRDVLVRCIRFILPEDLNVSATGNVLCNERKIEAKVFANYIDNNFYCCPLIVS